MNRKLDVSDEKAIGNISVAYLLTQYETAFRSRNESQ